jgi:hypothetical protein
MTTQLIAELKTPILVRESSTGFSSVAWNRARALVDSNYPQVADLYPGQYWVHKQLRNSTEFLIEGFDGQLIEVHQDNAELIY